ncbi:MAG: PDZ domain-containing protein [Ferruginibacter sp.]|nr:PDZ domain-containing protein [Ferruginibacter sp.]
MKRNIKLSIIGWLLGCIGGLNANAQTVDIVGGDENKKETQEIIIRKKGDKDTKFTMEITANKILINGKPLAEFSENGLTINNRKIITREGNKVSIDLRRSQVDMQRDMTEFEKNFEDINPGDISSITIMGDKNNNDFSDNNKRYVFLGVTTTDDILGAKISSIITDGPAEKAGLLKEDIITKINDSKIEEASSLSDVIRTMKTGDKVKVYYKRDGKEKTTTATLGETTGRGSKTMTVITKDGKTRSLIMPDRPKHPDYPKMEFNGSININSKPKLGLKIQDTEEANGVKVLEVETGSASATAGLLKGDLITEIGNVKVQNTDDARAQLQENSDKSNYPIKAKRNGNEMTFNIKIPKKLKTAQL